MIKNFVFYLIFVLIALVLELRHKEVVTEIRALGMPSAKKWIAVYRIVILPSRVIYCFSIVAGIIAFIKEAINLQFNWVSIDSVLETFFYTTLSFGIVGPITIFLMWVAKKKR